MSFTGSRLSGFYFGCLEKDETEKQTRISFFPDTELHSWEGDFLLPAKSPVMCFFSSDIAWQYQLEEMVLFGIKPYLFPPTPISFFFFFFVLDKKTMSFEEQKSSFCFYI